MPERRYVNGKRVAKIVRNDDGSVLVLFKKTENAPPTKFSSLDSYLHAVKRVFVSNEHLVTK